MEDEITQWLKALPSGAGAYIFKSLDIITNESGSQWYQVTLYDSNFYPNSVGIMCLNASVAFEFPWWISQKFCQYYPTVSSVSDTSQDMNPPTSWTYIESISCRFYVRTVRPATEHASGLSCVQCGPFGSFLHC